MPEYLAPGVYVEETSFRAKSIEGVSTTTTGFVGPSRYGPIDIEPDIITSVTEFERTYGDRNRLDFTNFPEMDNYLWQAARAFFEEGGKRLYVSRIFRTNQDEPYVRPRFNAAPTTGTAPWADGHARTQVPLAGAPGPILVTARFPGAYGNSRVRFTLNAGQNVLGGTTTRRTATVSDRDLVIITRRGQTPAYFEAERYYDATEQRETWQFVGPSGTVRLNQLTPDANPLVTDVVRIVTVTVTVTPPGRGATDLVWEGLALHPKHERAGTPDSIFRKFDANPPSMNDARTLPIVIGADSSLVTGIDVLNTLYAAEPLPASPPLSPPTGTHTLQSALETLPLVNGGPLREFQPRPDEFSFEQELLGGNDGRRPEADDYKGDEREYPDQQNPAKKIARKMGLVAFEDIEDISIVAAPGSTYAMEDGYRIEAAAAVSFLISHAERMRYRIAVIDSGDQQSISQVRAMRGKIDSKYAALYYPWVRVLDPVTGTERSMPPSGFVSGIYARNDIERAVYKAPANEVVRSAIGFETLLNKSQQDVLNPEGVNCFRFFEGRGFRLWGARTISSDPEWKYVNLRRYFAYLERSIDRGTQWAVFEPNGELLWANVRRTVEDFLLNEWTMGALLGDKPDKAYFVKCDRSTMTQNDLDNGRMICLIGVAALKPAEYVIFRIGQWTADRKV